MPELPEVENIRRRIHSIVSGKQLLDLQVSDDTLLKNCSPSELRQAIIDQPLQRVDRHGKYLSFEFPSHCLVNHLRMSGRWLFEQGDRTRLALIFEEEQQLYMDDLRRLGTLHLVSSDRLLQEPPLDNLGIDPLSQSFTRDRFHDLLSSEQEIKRLLMDQKKVAGLGNIYAAEILHVAKIHPLRKAFSLTDTEKARLFENIPMILKQAIEHEGTSFDALYKTPSGEPGNFQNLLSVYDREGAPCPHCSEEIHRIKQGQRSTYFCPNCQPLEQSGRTDPL